MTQYVLRPKQAEAAQYAVDFLTDGRKRNGVLVEPTAFGKSLLIAEIAHRLGGGLIVFQPGVEILEQNLAKIESYGYSPGVWSAAAGRKDLGEIVLATIGSVKKNPEIFEDYPHVLVDEGHGINSKEGMYKDFFEALGDIKILALTATPWRLSSNSMGTQAKFLTRTRPKIIDEVTHFTQISEMVKNEYWAKLEYFPISGFSRSKIPMNSTGADYDDEAVQLHLWEKNWLTKNKVSVHFPDKLTEMVKRLLDAGRKHILVFTSFIRESEYLAQQLKGECAVVTGETEKSVRRDIARDFRSGDIRVVTNVNCWTLGFDFPGLDCVIDAALTASLTRQMQKWGRLVRVSPEKESGYIVDMVGGLQTFGKLEDLTLYCEGNSKWGMWGRPGGGKEVQLTNTYLGGSALAGCCLKCHVPRFFAMYVKSGKMVPLSVPPPGSRGNIVVEQDGQKKTCRMVGRGEGTHSFHFIVCDRFRRLRESA